MARTKKNGELPGVEILLSTYNGARFIAGQLDSLLDQTYTNWTALVRDDGSSDGTVDIIKDYVASYPAKFTLIDARGTARLGAARSFARLLELSSADYVMFCDQDDVWLPDKVELTMTVMLESEARFMGRPVLVHTDLKVTDELLRELSPSFWEYQQLDVKLKRLDQLLLLNNVTGCTVMINSVLRDMAVPVPDGAVLHDWWLALVAAAFGRIEHISTPTVLYRQHGANEAGAARYSLGYYTSRVTNFDRSVALARRTVNQSRAFLDRYRDRLTLADLRAATGLSKILGSWRVVRLYKLLKDYASRRNMGVLALLVFIKDGTART